MTQKIKGAVYLATDFRWRAMVSFPNWFTVIFTRSYANEQTARQGITYFARKFGLKLKGIDINYLKHRSRTP